MYPPRSQVNEDFAQKEQAGQAVSGTGLATELANLSEIVNQLRSFIVGGFNSDGSWQPGEAMAQTLVDSYSYTASVGQTQYDFPTGTTADPSSDSIRVFTGTADGSLTRLDDSVVTLNASNFQIPAQTAGDRVLAELYNGSAGLRQDLGSQAANLGASLVAVEDALGRFSGSDVEGCLAELRVALDNLLSNLGDISTLIRSDGSVDFAANQSMGAFRLIDVADGVDPQDAATVAQLDALSAIYGDLSTIYLSLTGGTMQGPIDMAGSKITNLAEGTADGDAVNKLQMDTADDLRLHRTDDTKPGMERNLPMGDNRITGMADGTADTDAVTLQQLNAATGGAGYTVLRVADNGDSPLTVPEGTNSATVMMLGAGGGGGGGGSSNSGIGENGGAGGGGGGAGTVRVYTVDVSRIDPAIASTVSYVVGAGGSRGASGTAGGDGGDGGAGGATSITFNSLQFLAEGGTPGTGGQRGNAGSGTVEPVGGTGGAFGGGAGGDGAGDIAGQDGTDGQGYDTPSWVTVGAGGTAGVGSPLVEGSGGGGGGGVPEDIISVFTSELATDTVTAGDGGGGGASNNPGGDAADAVGFAAGGGGGGGAGGNSGPSDGGEGGLGADGIIVIKWG